MLAGIAISAFANSMDNKGATANRTRSQRHCLSALLSALRWVLIRLLSKESAHRDTPPDPLDVSWAQTIASGTDAVHENYPHRTANTSVLAARRFDHDVFGHAQPARHAPNQSGPGALALLIGDSQFPDSARLRHRRVGVLGDASSRGRTFCPVDSGHAGRLRFRRCPAFDAFWVVGWVRSSRSGARLQTAPGQWNQSGFHESRKQASVSLARCSQ